MVSTTSLGNFSQWQGELDFTQWLARISAQRTEQEKQLIYQACEWVKNTAEHAKCVQQICATVDILLDIGMDNETLVAAMLHPLADHHGLALDSIDAKFGKRIASLVNSALKMGSMDEVDSPALKDAAGQAAQSERLRKMLLAMVEDVRAVLLKLAERLYILRQLRHSGADEYRRLLARQTLNIHAPLANRLGIWQVKWEMEDLSLRFLEPENYANIAKLLEMRRVERENFIQNVKQEVHGLLLTEGIVAEVTGRPKHIYSIWRKMQRKQVDFHQVFDVHAVRVVVASQRDCYTALGIIHNRWTPIPGEFDDYIANPKSNGYKSLHTAVIGPMDHIFEAQIRTRDMHNHAELGVASHWRYKEGVAHDESFERKLAWLRQLLEWKDEGQEDSELLRQLDSEVFDKRVYVLTPQGQVIDLPQGATPLDFAYTIHTDIGHHCKGALVDGHIVPLNYTLKTGEQIEILQSKQERVNQDWLSPGRGYLATSRARNKVRAWLKQQNVSRHLAGGRAAVDRELKRLNAHGVSHDALAKHLGLDGVDTLFTAVGRGDMNSGQLANAVHRLLLAADAKETKQRPAPSSNAPESRESKKAAGVLPQWLGLDTFSGMRTEYAKCCCPQANDALMAYVSKERGIVIHRRDCEHVQRWLEEGNEKLIPLEPPPPPSVRHAMAIVLQAYDRMGLVMDVSRVLTEGNINITGLDTHTGVDKIARMTIAVEVSDIRQLQNALVQLELLPNVIEARRQALAS